MASNTKMTERRRAIRQRNMGKRRKRKESRRSTPTEQDLFAGCGEPGKPAPKAQ